MRIGVTGDCPALPPPAKVVRVVRWTFRRDDQAVSLVLGLSNDDSAYELRVSGPDDPAPRSELFDDAMSAFQRHAAIERMLVNDGWMLEAFGSEQVAR